MIKIPALEILSWLWENVSFTKRNRFLVVEDNQYDIEVITEYLNQIKASYDVCESGEQAHRMLQEKKYHIAFVDLRLPKMDGMKLIGKIMDETPRTTVVIVLTQAEDLIKFPHGTFISIIIKPVTLHAIKEAVEKLK